MILPISIWPWKSINAETARRHSKIVQKALYKQELRFCYREIAKAIAEGKTKIYLDSCLDCSLSKYAINQLKANGYTITSPTAFPNDLIISWEEQK